MVPCRNDGKELRIYLNSGGAAAICFAGPGNFQFNKVGVIRVDAGEYRGSLKAAGKYYDFRPRQTRLFSTAIAPQYVNLKFPITDDQLAVSGTDPLSEAAARDEVAFNAALNVVEPYLVADSAGILSLNVPDAVRAQVSEDTFQAMLLSVDVLNDFTTNSDAEEETVVSAEQSQRLVVASVPGEVAKAFLKFAKKNWKTIVKAAKKSGKWAWWKYGQCMRGAVNNLYNTYGLNVAYLVTDRNAAIGAAAWGCIRAL
jgi:hypothetical protein